MPLPLPFPLTAHPCRLPKPVASLAALALSVLCLAGCNKPAPPETKSTASSSPAASKEPIKVGVQGAYSGGSSPMGVSMRDGVRLAAEEINNAGGLLGGRKIELVERDDQSNNERGAQVMQDLLNSQKVVAVLGVINTGVAQASYRYPQEAKVPFIINVATGAEVNEHFKNFPDNYVFGLRPNDTMQTELIAAEAIDKRSYKKVAILADDTNYGQNGRMLMEEALKRRNITPVSVGKFKIKDTDMTPQLQEAPQRRHRKPCSLLRHRAGAGADRQRHADARLEGAAVGSWTLSMSNFIDAAGSNGDGTVMPQTVIENGASGEKTKKFIADFKKKFNVDRLSFIGGSTQGYDALYIVCRAMNQAGTTEGPALKAALENLKEPYVGATATFSPPFTPTDHEAIHEKDIVMGMISGGQILPANKP